MAFDIGTAEEKWQRKIRFMRRLPHTMTGIRRMMQRTLILERMSNAGHRTGMNTTLKRWSAFIGLFLGAMFLMVTVLIILQADLGGYEDKERYAIMEKVGMSNAEVKRSIRTQILTVFFLPIRAAVLHVVMAFPMIKWILAAFSLNNTALFALCVAVTALVFLLIYLLVFALTSRSYYKIVGNQV